MSRDGFLMRCPVRHVVYGPRRYRINPAFDIVLGLRHLFSDERLESVDKISLALELLAGSPWSRFWIRCLPVPDKIGLFRKVDVEMLHTKKRPKLPDDGPPVLDFEEDGEYIYASFVDEYGIDLVKQRGKLEWREFIALFEGLSGESKIKEVMRIRRMEVPTPNGHNQKEIRRISQLKMFYALPVKERQKNGADMLFQTLERMAGR